MIRGRAIAAPIAVAAALAACRPAAAEPAPHGAPVIAAVAVDPHDARAAILVGPGGQIYRPDGAGAWTRTAGGGIAAGVVAAVRDGDDLIAAAPRTPLYRWHDGAWRAEPVGAHGAILLGAGPAPAVAVGTRVLVRAGDAWRPVGRAPGPPTALWARSPGDIWIVVDGAPWHLRGGRFTRTAGTATAIVGARPWALAGPLARRLDARIRVGAAGAGTVLGAATVGAATWLLVRDGRAAAVERHGTGTAPPAPPAGDWAWLWADPAGRVAIAAPDGHVAILDGGAWRTTRAGDRLAAPRPGPGPARSP